MTFRIECCDDFIALFHQYKEQIRNAKGCKSLTLLRDNEESNIFFTYSIWDNEQALDDYRYSETFAEVWPLTKALFGDNAEAWTTEPLVQL